MKNDNLFLWWLANGERVLSRVVLYGIALCGLFVVSEPSGAEADIRRSRATGAICATVAVAGLACSSRRDG
jgi:hypothetical protein